jgi:hypothetical protein
MKNDWREIRLRQTVYARCPVTGKRRRRTKTFRQAFDLFNRDADGRLKMRSQILDELIEEACAWKPACACADCRRYFVQAAIPNNNPFPSGPLPRSWRQSE